MKEPVILTYPCWEEEFHIEADACATEVGAALGQIDERKGKVRPIEYFSPPSAQVSATTQRVKWRHGQPSQRHVNGPSGIDRSSPTYRSLSFEVDPGPKGSQAHVHSVAHGTTRNATAYRDAIRQG